MQPIKTQATFFYRSCAFLFATIVIFIPAFSFAIGDDFGISEMRQSVESKKERIEKLQDRIRELKKGITKKQTEAVTLSNQLSILSDRIKQVEAEIELSNDKIDETKTEIELTKIEITKLEKNISDNKDRLKRFLRKHYKMEQRRPFDVFITSKSLSEYFNQLIAVSDIEMEIKKSIDALTLKRKDVKVRQKILLDKQASISELKEKQEEDKIRLEQQRSARAVVLGEARSSEERFKHLLQQAKAEQNKVNTEIRNIEQTIRKRLESLGSAGLQRLGPVTSMIDPVTPRRITTYFYDPHYPFRYLFEHPGLDLAVPQGSPVRAAAPGFVAKVKDGGLKSYSYVVLVHSGGISTVYMHVSKILAKEGQFVNQGDIIALSGGTPGTPGAGRLSTGAHIQFEVRVNGNPVDPLKYLSK